MLAREPKTFPDAVAGFTKDRWVDMVEIRPWDRSVVHFAVIFYSGSKIEVVDRSSNIPFVTD